MSEHLPPPSDELRGLIALEQDELVEPAAAVRARLAERLGVALVAPIPAPAPAPVAQPSGAPLFKLTGAAALVGAGAAVGAAVHALLATPASRVEVRYVDRIVEVERRVPSAPPAPDKAADTPSAGLREPPAARSPRTHVRDVDLSAESALLDRARSALARRDAPGALAAIGEHARAFPRGQLAEAREALAVEALVEAHQETQARARAARFHERFPQSPYAVVVDAALAKLP